MIEEEFVKSLNNTLEWLLSMREMIGNHLAAVTLSACAATGTKAPTINYEASYKEADKVINNYQHYKQCVEGFDQKPLPVMKVLTNRATDLDIIDSYSDYVNDLINYIHDMKTDCHPPMDIKLPIYKSR